MSKRTKQQPLTAAARSQVALVHYDAACKAIAAARNVDDVKDIRDVSIAMRAYARQAGDKTMEANAIEIRMRATRRMDQMRQEQKATVGLATGGERGGRKRIDGVRNTPSNAARPTLAEAGIDKNLAKEGRKLGALSDDEFKAAISKARDAGPAAVAKVVKSTKPVILPEEEEENDGTDDVEITLAQWKRMSAEERSTCLDRNNYPNDAKFNKQTSDGIDWAQWSWNPIVGCKHSCRKYCWANDVTLRFPGSYPHGFAPVLRPRKLTAPYTMKVPPEAATDGRFKNVFSCSMSDLFGGWIFPEWIEAVLAAERENPQWNFLHLTKFPKRIADFDIPPNAWMGTTVDLQVRVKNAEAAFVKLRERNPKAILWLSIEPMLEPLTFQRLDLFDWMVIGGAAKSRRTPEFRPPHRWIVDLIRQADAAGVKIFEKTNLHGNRILELPFDAPVKTEFPQKAPNVFHYLGKSDAEDAS